MPKKDASKDMAVRPQANVQRTDASMIISRLATIDDPMLSYLIGMMLDRVAQIVAAKREGRLLDEPRPEVLVAAEPHGVPFSAAVPGEPIT